MNSECRLFLHLKKARVTSWSTCRNVHPGGHGHILQWVFFQTVHRLPIHVEIQVPVTRHLHAASQVCSSTMHVYKDTLLPSSNVFVDTLKFEHFSLSTAYTFHKKDLQLLES